MIILIDTVYLRTYLMLNNILSEPRVLRKQVYK